MEERFEQLLREIQSIKQIVLETKESLPSQIHRVSQLEEKYNVLSNQVQDVTEENVNLKWQIERMEQYSRKNNMIINGVPFMTDENVREIVKEIAAKLKVDIKNEDIAAAHRLSAKSEIPPIIVKFVNQETKPKMIVASKKMKIDGNVLNYRPAFPIYCNEHLSRRVKQILAAAKKLQSAGYLKYVWIRNGEVKVREADDTAAVTIYRLSQLGYNEAETIHNMQNQSEKKTDKRMFSNNVNYKSNKRRMKQHSRDNKDVGSGLKYYKPKKFQIKLRNFRYVSRNK